MKCDCITALEKSILENEEIAYVEPRHSLTFNEGKLTAVLPIYFRCKEKKADGTEKRNFKLYSMLANYCPFCGEKALSENQIRDKQ